MSEDFINRANNSTYLGNVIKMKQVNKREAALKTNIDYIGGALI